MLHIRNRPVESICMVYFTLPAIQQVTAVVWDASAGAHAAPRFVLVFRSAAQRHTSPTGGGRHLIRTRRPRSRLAHPRRRDETGSTNADLLARAAAGEGIDGAVLLADYRRHSLTIGSRVRATLPGDRELVGVAQAIDELGRLRIDTGDDVVAVSAGDITHLRPPAP